MDFEVVWTEPALADLESALLAARDPDAVRLEILAATGLLSRFPFLGPAYERDQTGRAREVACRGHRVFYRVDEAAARVEVVCVWPARRREPRLPG